MFAGRFSEALHPKGIAGGGWGGNGGQDASRLRADGFRKGALRARVCCFRM